MFAATLLFPLVTKPVESWSQSLSLIIPQLTGMLKQTTFLFLVVPSIAANGQSFNNFPGSTQKPPLHGKHWMAITAKPLAATAGAMIFSKGGNAVDASCAMLAATCTMWDVRPWGGETQALIYNPKTK